jgi:hypothetical protein
VHLDLPLIDGAPAVLEVETVLTLDSSDRRVHQVLDAFGLGSGRDGLALGDLFAVG